MPLPITNDSVLNSWALMTLASLSKQIGQLDQRCSDQSEVEKLKSIETRIEAQLEAFHGSGVETLALMEITKDINAFKAQIGR